MVVAELLEDSETIPADLTVSEEELVAVTV